MEKKIENNSRYGEDDLFIRMENFEEDGKMFYGWYKLSSSDVEIEQESSDVLSPCFKLTQPECRFDPSHVAFGPFIFVIGGTDFDQQSRFEKLYRDVYVMDTRNPEAGWNKGPKLLTGLTRAYAFALGETICLIGGFSGRGRPYGHVLDIETGIWKFLKTRYGYDLPMDINGHGILFNKDIDDPEEDKSRYLPDSFSEYPYYEYSHANCHPYPPKDLYVTGKGAFHSYNFETATWKLIKKNVRSSACHSCSQDDVLYVLSPKFMGYSMSKGKWFHVSLSAFDEYENSLPPTDSMAWWSTPPCCLVPLGNGVLCILWTDFLVEENVVLLHYTKFTINVEETDDGELSSAVDIMFYRTYMLPPGTMVDCVAVSKSSTITFPFVE